MNNWKPYVIGAGFVGYMSVVPCFAQEQPSKARQQTVWVNPGITTGPPADLGTVVSEAKAILIGELIEKGSEWKRGHLFSTLRFRVGDVVKDNLGTLVTGDMLLVFSPGGEYQPAAQPVVTGLSDEAKLYQVRRHYFLPLGWDAGWEFWYIRYGSGAAIDVTDRLPAPLFPATALARNIAMTGLGSLPTKEFIEHVRRVASAPKGR